MASTLRLRSFRGSGRGCLLFGVFLLAGCFVSDEHVGAEPAANVEQAVPGAVGGARAAEASALDSGLLVIGPSFGRTGTASTRAALGILGFGPTHHMAEVIENQAFDAWSRIAVEKNKTVRQALLREELRGYRSAVDAPSAVFYQVCVYVCECVFSLHVPTFCKLFCVLFSHWPPGIWLVLNEKASTRRLRRCGWQLLMLAVIVVIIVSAGSSRDVSGCKSSHDHSRR